VEEWVFVVYASLESAAESQFIGVTSSATGAEELAERYAGVDRYGWRPAGWSGTAPGGCAPVDGRGNAVEVWLMEVGLDGLFRLVLESEPLVEEHD
jgi:hypothetical protein